MMLSAVTNEVLPDRSPDAFDRIFPAAVAEGITNFELRMVESRRFPLVDPDAWVRLRAKSREFGITYSTVSPGLYQLGLDSELLPLHEKHLVPMSLDLAERLDVSTLIVFGARRSARGGDEEFGQVLDLLGRTADVAAARGFDVQLENLPGTWADTSDACLALLEGVNRPNFGYVWDTGNLYEAEREHFKAGYDKLKPHIRTVHLKDGRIEDGAMVWQHYGQGVTDIEGQVRTLSGDGYDGSLTLEAACDPHREEDFSRSARYLKSVLAAA